MRRFAASSAWAWLGWGLVTSGLGCVTTGGAFEPGDDTLKANSHLEIGADHMANGRFARALREFLAAEQFDPENARVQYALGEAYIASRDKRAEAEQHLRRALDLSPDYHDARQALSALLLIEKRYAEVIPECDRLIDDPTFPSPWRALTNRASAEQKLGRTQQARDTLMLAREYEQGYWPATLALAILEVDSGRRVEAIRLFQDIIAQGPGASVESEVNYRIAEIYVSLGKRREAMGHLTTSVARAPDSQWAKKSQEYLKLLH